MNEILLDYTAASHPGYYCRVSECPRVQEERDRAVAEHRSFNPENASCSTCLIGVKARQDAIESIIQLEERKKRNGRKWNIRK